MQRLVRVKLIRVKKRSKRKAIDATEFVKTLPSDNDTERDKALYWRDYKRRHGPAAGIRIADELRQQVLALRPDWPDAMEQAAKRRVMKRIDDALARATPRRHG